MPLSLYSSFYTHFYCSSCGFVLFFFFLYSLLSVLCVFRIYMLCFSTPPSLPTNRRLCPKRKAQISCAKNQNVFYVIYTLAQRGVAGCESLPLQCCPCGTPPSCTPLAVEYIYKTCEKRTGERATRHQVAPLAAARVNFSPTDRLMDSSIQISHYTHFHK